MSDALYQSLGGTHFRRSDTLTNGSLTDTFNSSQVRILAWMQAAINYELGPVWTKATRNTALEGVDPVAGVLEYDATPKLTRQTKIPFPLLAFFPVTGEDSEEATKLDAIGVKTTWMMQYILPALDPEDFARVAGVLTAVHKLVRLTLANRYHASYDSGYSQFDTGKVEFSSIAVTKTEIGAAKFADNDGGVTFPICEMLIETTESQTWDDGISTPFDGIDATLGIEGTGGVLPAKVFGSS